ncbi:putative hydro-lyase [Pseudalkalibacillus hwajinpoensis]|uniref:putative hydro-lyase n=1 Tax=Guptibacillus hwajinpoensis TaxID=208199 RepID=UPI001CD550E1|nr:putative hydro-lyase [Pseudalkalibacillus hwajinpoensis]MCA0992149.1 putative hydro-lyase [Pseudalkalibacillus hwajinpoensis]
MVTPQTQRRKYRDNLETGTTSGVCDGYLQANMITLPSKYAFEFLLFCQRNPKPCPIVDVLEAGQVNPRIADADIRTDLPKYRIYKNGELEKETLDLKDVWQEDYVTFLLGCSFTFEKALVERGISLLHQEMDLVVPMYQTNIPCEEAGQFNGNMVVSMRAIRKEELDQTIAITSKFPHAHGAPIHVGHPSEIGIQDIEKPDYGEFPPFDEEERIPVFWACGVTPQYVGLNVKPEMMITHAPGHMLITDQEE